MLIATTILTFATFGLMMPDEMAVAAIVALIVCSVASEMRQLTTHALIGHKRQTYNEPFG